jgi:hypothetical protein
MTNKLEIKSWPRFYDYRTNYNGDPVEDYDWKYDWEENWEMDYEIPHFCYCCGAAIRGETTNKSQPLLRRGITIHAGFLGKPGIKEVKSTDFETKKVTVDIQHIQTKAGPLTCVIALPTEK